MERAAGRRGVGGVPCPSHHGSGGQVVHVRARRGVDRAQFADLRREREPITPADIAVAVQALDARIATAVTELGAIDPATLGDWRGVGRAQLPSTVVGCLVHGAEHAMRHVGALSVTVRIVRDQGRNT